jgi:spore maturation protein A
MPHFKDEEALEYVSMNIAANILGLGYGATPSGLKAIKRMQESNDGDKEEATDEMVTFLVLNTAGVTIIPTTVISIRSALGSVNPSDMILLPIIATFTSCLAGLLVDYYYRKKNRKI